MEYTVETLEAELGIEEFIAGFVDVDRFRECCEACRGYGKTWACPPYDFEPMEIWRGYSSILLYAKKVLLPESETAVVREPHELAACYIELLKPVKQAMLNELFEMEKAAPGSMALSAGGCDLCGECTRGGGLPCRFPERLRYSVESIGGNVLKCITDVLGETVLWAGNGRLPEHFILLGGLLKKS